MRDRTCENCCHCGPVLTAYRACRRHAPQPRLGIAISASWPIVMSHDWCSEWGAMPDAVKSLEDLPGAVRKVCETCAAYTAKRDGSWDGICVAGGWRVLAGGECTSASGWRPRKPEGAPIRMMREGDTVARRYADVSQEARPKLGENRQVRGTGVSSKNEWPKYANVGDL